MSDIVKIVIESSQIGKRSETRQAELKPESEKPQGGTEAMPKTEGA
jgi:hypothetical protein